MEIRDARFIASATDVRRLPAPAFAEIAFAGRSNVGKSSLINSLTRRKKLVRTSNTPGCTRGINVFRVELKDPDGVIDLVDLPGYGYAKRSKAERRSWGKLVEGFLSTRPGLRGVVVIVDVRRGPEDDDAQLLEHLEGLGIPAVVVATKVDKLAAAKRKPALAAIARAVDVPIRGYSAPTGTGRDALWTALLEMAAIGAVRADAGAITS